MKRRVVISLGALVALYCVLWVGTFLSGRAVLEREMRAELKAEWRRCRVEAEGMKEHFPGERDRIAFPDGPTLKIKVFSCRGPLLVYAEVDRTVGGLNGRGTIGRYLITPWRVYVLWERRTWVS